MLYWWKVFIYFILQKPLEKPGEDGRFQEEVFIGVFHADREGIDMLGVSRVTGVGGSLHLQLGGLGAGVSVGWSFILRSNKARLLSAFNIYFFASAYLLYLTCCDSKREWIKRVKNAQALFIPVFLCFEKGREYDNLKYARAVDKIMNLDFWLHMDICTMLSWASHHHLSFAKFTRV